MAQNGNGKTPQVSISTLIQTKYQGGDLYQAISQLLERRPTGKLLINVSQGGINSMEWVENASYEKNSGKV